MRKETTSVERVRERERDRDIEGVEERKGGGRNRVRKAVLQRSFLPHTWQTQSAKLKVKA